MRTNPLRFDPDADNLGGGGGNKGDPRGTGAATTGTSGSHRPKSHTGGDTPGPAEHSNDDPDRPAGELRQDVMPDLDPPDGGTPNPT